MLLRLFAALLLSAQVYVAHAQMNMTLLAKWNNPNLPKVDGDQIWNDLIGWHDTVNNREYIITGTGDSIYFFDITNPTNPVLCDVEKGRATGAVNRDFETYSHYVYTVSDRSTTPGSLQIFDMQYLPDSVSKVYDNDTFSINTHTLFIEPSRERMYLCGNAHKPAGMRSMAIFSLANPLSPAYLGEIPKSEGCAYTHEMYARNDTAFLSCGYEGLYIYDVRNAAAPVQLGSILPPYPQNGYNHSSWLDSSGKFLLFTDENQGLGIKMYDISDIRNPDFITVFNSNVGALPHNAYWKGRFAYVSSYEDGVVVYDLQDPKSLKFKQPPLAGWYDTYTLNPTGVYNGFHGCWGVWPFLPSGVIVASDMSEGIFILQPSPTLRVDENMATLVHSSVYPNPFSAVTQLTIHSLTTQEVTLRIFDQTARLISERVVELGQGGTQIELSELIPFPSGLYHIRLENNRQRIYHHVIKN